VDVCRAMAVVFKLCAWTELFSEKNVISVSIDVMRRNTDIKISKLKHQHPDGAHCTLQTSSLTYNVISVVIFSVTVSVTFILFQFQFQLFFQLLFQKTEVKKPQGKNIGRP